MSWKALKLTMVCSAALLLPCCGSNQRLLGINVTPTAITFGSSDPTLNAQLTATGVYTHPPANKDITTQVTWSSSVAGVAVVNSSGKVSPTGSECGVTNITASLQTNDPTGNVVSGTMTVTVNGPATDGCPSTPI